MDKSLEDAIRFISQELIDNPGSDRSELIERVCSKFDLNPLQADFLYNKYVYVK